MLEENEIYCKLGDLVSGLRRVWLPNEESDETEENVECICSDCARGNGGEWPSGHLATMHLGKCDICGEEHSLSNVNDWLWSNNDTQTVWD